jgi:hypothetical protein
MLRICRQYVPPGIRLAGEIDYKHEEPLALALAEAIRLEGDITVNMAGLAFIDGSCARMIVDAARGLASSRSLAATRPRGRQVPGCGRRRAAGPGSGVRW